jgi:hypothetical protein
VTDYLPSIFTSLVLKLDCEDLEGISHLPEDIRPRPSQKPHVMAKLTETSEEVRMLYIKLLESLVFLEYVDNNILYIHIQNIVNISRTMCMDPCTLIVVEACVLVKNLTIKFRELLFYFNTDLARSLLYPLTHKQSKLRLVALDALEVLMTCSPNKKNVDIMENLIGFNDPNLVPIKDFYEPSTRLNYLALLVADPSPAVIKRFFEMITKWLLELTDKYDHESRLIPYLLSGYFIPHEDINEYIAQRFDDIGKQYEKDYEKDIREDRQYGVDAKWTEYCKVDGFYPFPLKNRPRLGCRILIKKYVRRYIKNLCKEIDSIEESIRVKVANLILFSIAFTEEHITEYLDQILLCFERELSKTKNTNKEVQAAMIQSLKLLGKFCDYDSISNLIFPTIEGNLNANYQDIQRGGLICFKYILQGHLEALKDDGELGVFANKFEHIVEVLNSKAFIDCLDSTTALELIDVSLKLILVL